MTSVTMCNLVGNMNVPSTSTAFDFKGQCRRRVFIFIKGIASAQADTLTDYVPELVGIEGIVYCTISDAKYEGTQPTWSGVVLTYPSKSGATIEMCIVGRMK